MINVLHQALSPFRRLFRKPTFAIAVILILALGIGLNVATLGLLYRYYVSPLPYPQGGRVATVYMAANVPAGDKLSVPTYEALRKRAPALADAGLYRAIGYNLVRGGQSRRLEGAQMTASAFTTLGVQPVLGQAFNPATDKPGAQPVVVLSYRLWQSLFDGKRSALGATLHLNGKLYTVIGVMPKDFAFPTTQAELWTPRVIEANELGPNMVLSFTDNIVVRLAPGASLQQLTTQANAVLIGEARPVDRALIAKYQAHLVAQGWRASHIKGLAHSLTLVQVATALLMLLVWFNLANLFLARAYNRRSELALRRILGAGTGTLAASMAAENFMLSLLGALFGAIFGRFLLGLFAGSDIAAMSSSIPGTSWPELIGIAVVLAVISAAIFTAVGLGFLHTRNLAAVLGEESARTSHGPFARRVRTTLLVSQIALACALAGCGLLLGRSLLNLNAVNLGFTSAHTVTFKFDLPASQYSFDRMTAALDTLRTSVAQTAGIQSASITSDVPFDGSEIGTAVFPRPMHPGVSPTSFIVTTDAGFIHALGLSLLAGRNFLPSDAKNAMGVALIDALTAKQLFGTTQAIGRQFSFLSPEANGPGDLYRVIGIVSTSRRESVGAAPAQGSAYLDRNQIVPFMARSGWRRSWYLAVRSSLPASTIVSQVRNTAHQVLPGVPLYDIKTMRQRVSGALASNRLLTILVGLFAFGALLLAAIGLYAVQTYAVAQRAREFAIRAALGAERSSLLAMVLGEAARLLVIGLVIGLAGLAGIGIAFASAFYGIAAIDPLSMAVVAIVLAAATLAASWFPAWRASRVSPNEALRE
ncbi:MAG: ABC transporter permease [Gammaproteobacteria bacterium]